LFIVKQILSSDLLRSCSVAHEIARACKELPLIVSSEELREVYMGRMTGMTKADALVSFPERRHRSSHAHYDYQDIGGECADDVAFRVMRTIDNEAFRLQQQCCDEYPTIVLVGHGTALRTVFVDRLRAFRKLHTQGDFQVCDWLIGQL
jgi:broad specificity phosphatase PhoE